MNNKCLSLLCLLALLSVPAVASDIYKRVNEDGVVEFSDRPMENSSRVEVNPNVVATNQVQRRDRVAAPPASDAAQAAPGVSQSSARIADDNNYRLNESRRARNEARERREQRGTRQELDSEEVTDPNPGRALRNAARAAGGGAR